MLTIDRYVLRELSAAVAATTIVLLFVALGAVVADLMQEIALGKVPVAAVNSLG